MSELGAAAIALAAVAAVLLCLPVGILGGVGLERGLAWRSALVSGCVIGAFLLGMHAWLPDALERSRKEYLLGLTLGYGHLIGGTVFARRRVSRFVPSGVPDGLFWSFIGVSLLVVVTLALWNQGEAAFHPNAYLEAAFVVLLAISAWHFVENHFMLGRAYRSRLRLVPLPRSPDYQILSIGLSLLVTLILLSTRFPGDQVFPALGGAFYRESLIWLTVALGAALLLRGRLGPLGLAGVAMAAGATWMPRDLTGSFGIDFADAFVGMSLFHVIEWLVFFGDRARNPFPGEPCVDGRALWRRIAVVHLPPALLCALLWASPAGPVAAVGFLFFTPVTYSFWTMLHVLQTAVARGLEPAPEPA